MKVQESEGSNYVTDPPGVQAEYCDAGLRSILDTELSVPHMHHGKARHRLIHSVKMIQMLDLMTGYQMLEHAAGHMMKN